MKFSRVRHEGHECPECSGVHYGTNHCPNSKEGLQDTTKIIVSAILNPPAPNKAARAAVKRYKNRRKSKVLHERGLHRLAEALNFGDEIRARDRSI